MELLYHRHVSVGTLVPRVHAPARARKPLAAVACSPDPLGARSAPPTWLVEGLVARGLLVVTLELQAPSRAAGEAEGSSNGGPPMGDALTSLTLWDLVGGMEDALEAAASSPGVDASRVGVLGVQGGSPLALVGGSRPAASRLAVMLPWSPEIAARRIERSAGGSPREALIKALAELQPLRALADAPAKPTLVLHAAADRNGGPEHALAIAMGLHLDGRHIERLALAFASPESLLGDAASDRGEAVDRGADAARAGVISALATFFLEDAS